MSDEEQLDDVEWRKQWHFQSEADELAPLDNGLPGFRLNGLRDVEGTFAGTLDAGVDALWGAGTKEPVTVYLYGPDPHTRWWRHWFYKIREAIRGTPYPTIVLASGPATINFDDEYEDGNDIVFSGSFTKAGTWDIHEEVDHQ